jgi:hypothetical protein
VCKVRGITLNYSASQLVNFDVMKDMILRGDRTKGYIALREVLSGRGRVGEYI